MKFALIGLDKDLLDVLGKAVVAVFDPNLKGAVWGIPVIGGEAAWPGFKSTHPDVRPLLALDPPRLRRNLASHYGFDDLASFIAPSARISERAQLGAGVVAQSETFISADVIVESGVRINVGARIHHDCIVGSFTTLAPGAALMGSVRVGRDVYVGAGAIVLQGISIGDGATIGAGAVVTKPVAAGETMVGVPARPIHSSGQ